MCLFVVFCHLVHLYPEIYNYVKTEKKIKNEQRLRDAAAKKELIQVQYGSDLHVNERQKIRHYRGRSTGE